MTRLITLRLPLQEQGVSKASTESSSWHIRHSAIANKGASSSYESLFSSTTTATASEDEGPAISSLLLMGRFTSRTK
ncbi:hypothetical protein HanXRQr2_Chr17g0796111 [Helianthus annuus]|uniref:Uncharacterized protein n=1 Tax=Helianthus annuus TaxID=4232 RepID=A0A9K3DG01_HELAN|nr:hypothetical protein HanXRQr2_Chr17g0796111 [Helianthus annuus]